MITLHQNVYQSCQSNISVIPYLEKHMGFTARLYEEDICIYRQLLHNAAKNACFKEQAFFWICRNDGSYCAAEQDVFIQETTANQNCQFVSSYTTDKVHAFIVEVTGIAGSDVMGNVYKLNMEAYANDVRRFSQPALKAQDMPNQVYPVACHAFPVSPAYLNTILAYQKECRRQLAKAG